MSAPQISDAGLRQTPLHAEHAALGARRSPFAGYDMPVFYNSIYDEAAAVRGACGMFDVSHMARLEFPAGAEPFLQTILTCDVRRIRRGSGAYALVLNEEGGILDDVILYRRLAGDFLLVVNASNHKKIADWIAAQGGRGDDRTADTAMLAVQGPKAEEILSKVLPGCRDLFYFECRDMPWPEIGSVWISRTGYTGEDGFELVLPAGAAPKIWKWLMNVGKVAPCGLGARDVLRIEAGYSLYGSDMDESVSPFECGLGFAVAEGAGFIGAAALKARPIRTRMAGLVAGDSPSQVMRHGFAVTAGGKKVGHVTSGVYSKTLSKSIAFARLAVDAQAPGEAGATLAVEIRGRSVGVSCGSRRFAGSRVKARRPD